MFFPVSAYGSYHKFGFEIQAWNLTKKKANTTAVAYSKNSTQGHFFSSQVLSAGGLSESSGINAHCVFTLLSCETWYAKRKKKLPAFLAARWYLQTLCSWTSLPGSCFCFAPFSRHLWICWWIVWQAWPGSPCALWWPYQQRREEKSVTCSTARFISCDWQTGLGVNSVAISAVAPFRELPFLWGWWAVRKHLHGAVQVLRWCWFCARLHVEMVLPRACFYPALVTLRQLSYLCTSAMATHLGTESLEPRTESSQHSSKLRDLDWISLVLWLSLQCLKVMLKCLISFFSCQSICREEGKSSSRPETELRSVISLQSCEETSIHSWNSELSPCNWKRLNHLSGAYRACISLDLTPAHRDQASPPRPHVTPCLTRRWHQKWIWH